MEDKSVNKLSERAENEISNLAVGDLIPCLLLECHVHRDGMILPACTSTNLSHPKHLSNGEEIFGLIGSIRPVDDETVVAIIGNREILLPASLKLPVSRQVFVLHLDGEFYARGIP